MRLLTVSKEEDLKRRVTRLFPDHFERVNWEPDAGKVLQRLRSSEYDLLLLASQAFTDQEKTLINVIETVSEKSPLTQILLLIEPERLNVALSALRAGMYHYAKTPVTDDELSMLIKAALEDQPRYGTNALVENTPSPDRMGQLVGRSEAMQDVFKQIKQAAATDIPILLLGETGTGKDLVARTIHACSHRSDKSYLPVNLGSLPSELVASELFGHEKGSFSGAINQHKGVFERATDGTVFLDEIDATEEKVRVSLLRLIETKRFTRLGGRQQISSNARLITASNSDLPTLVKEGRFRKDLFYRIDGFRIKLPSLRERPDDIPLLIDEMLHRFSDSMDKKIVDVSPEFIEHLRDNDWPGNIRELKNVIQRSILVCEGETLAPHHLPPRFIREKPKPKSITFKIGTPLNDVERVMVLRALEAADNNRKEAARLLGISRRAIYNKLNKHKIK